MTRTDDIIPSRNGIERDTYREYEIWVLRRNGYWAVIVVRTGHNLSFESGGYATYLEAKRAGIEFIDNWFEAMNKIWRFES